MGMKALLQKCDYMYVNLPHCDKDDEIVSCSDCCTQDFYDRPDTYSCLKKLCHYTLNYGPAYASEIYHYLEKSHLLEDHFNGKNINVLSLGCGFSPDVYALRKYINDYDLDITYQYTGYDKEENWNEIREFYKNRHFETRDLLDGFSLQNYDIIFMCKAFSTIKRNGDAPEFLQILKQEVDKMESGVALFLTTLIIMISVAMCLIVPLKITFHSHLIIILPLTTHILEIILKLGKSIMFSLARVNYASSPNRM